MQLPVPIDRRERGHEDMWVTPELARKWLLANEFNRGIRKKAILKTARDMAAGRWLYTGEAIKFSWDGLLRDGQHRLESLIFAARENPDVRIETLVVFGLDPAAQRTMDRGIGRTAGDMYKMAGHHNGNNLASILKKAFCWEMEDYKFSNIINPTMAELDDVLERHPEIERSVEIATRLRSQFKYIPPSIGGIAHYLFVSLAEDETPEFFARFGDGANIGTEHPVYRLRKKFEDDFFNKGKTTAEWIKLGWIIRAWNAYIQNADLSAIVVSPRGDMPMPHGKSNMLEFSA